jgi:hypothetical protein
MDGLEQSIYMVIGWGGSRSDGDEGRRRGVGVMGG